MAGVEASLLVGVGYERLIVDALAGYLESGAVPGGAEA
jgi:hypothetical protein